MQQLWEWWRSRRLVMWTVAHKAATGFLIGACFVIAALLVLTHQQRDLRALTRSSCEFQQRSWRTQRAQIRDDAVPVKPSEAILRAFPQFRPFYDPENPLYADQIRALNARRDRKLRILGLPPSC